MKIRNFILASFVLALSCMTAGAQSMSSLESKVASSRVSFNYSLKTSGKVPLNASGHVLLQGDAFYMEGNGLKIWCDGKQRATMDPEAKEVYYEKVTADDFDTNPALLVNSFGKGFKVISEKAGKYEGAAVTVAKLQPVSRRSNITSITVYLAADDVIKALLLKTADGSSTTIKISSLTYTDKKQDLSAFRLDRSKISKDYMVTEF